MAGTALPVSEAVSVETEVVAVWEPALRETRVPEEKVAMVAMVARAAGARAAIRWGLRTSARNRWSMVG